MTGPAPPRQRLLLLLIGSVLWLFGSSPVQAQSPPAVKTVSDTVAVNPSGRLEVDNRRGRISIETWDRDEVGYRVRIEPPNDGGDVSFTSLDVSHSESKVKLDPDFPWRFQIPGFITISPGGAERAVLHYTIAVPASIELELDAHRSTIDLSGLTGPVEIDLHSGSVTGTNLSGGLNLEIHSGKTRLTYTRFTAPISIDSFDGAVRLTLPAGVGFDLETQLSSADQLTAGESLSLPSPAETNYEGPVNGGGPLVSIDAPSGTIELRTP